MNDGDKMRLYERKDAKIIVLTDDGASCPILKLSGKNISLKDDYHGKIKSSLIGKISSTI